MKNVLYYSSAGLNSKEKNIYYELQGFINSNLENSKYSRQFNLGYEIYGILLVGFCQWIHEQMKQKQINKVFFLSRDGYIVKQVYDKLYPEDSTNYLHVSRKSLILPSVKSQSINDIIDALILPPSFKIEDVLLCLNLEKKLVDENKYNLDKVYYRKKIHKYDEIKTLILDLQEEIEKNIKIQKDNFKEYLKKEDFIGKIAIIDIGWHNSIQKALVDVIERETIDAEIHGFYLGVYNDAKKIKKKHTASGYLYEYGNNINMQYKTFSFVSLLELFFLKDEGTTLIYEKKNRTVYPKLDTVAPNQDILIQDFQAGALKFVDDLCKSKLKTFKINNKIASNSMINFGVYPKKEEIEKFGNIKFENFSYNNMINFNNSNFYYYLHLREAKKDFFKSGWRIVFLRKLIPIPFPHYWLFYMMCTMFL